MRFHEAIHGVYFDDLDAFQVLHNARYLLMFERTLGSFWQQFGWGGLLDPKLNPDQFHVVRANQFEYLRPVKGTGTVRVRVWVDKLGSTSMQFAGLILPMDSDEPYARGHRTVVKVDPEGLRPTAWSADFRATIAPWVRPA